MPPVSPLTLDPVTLDRFLAHCQHHDVPARMNIFSPGDRAGAMFYVTRGSLNIVVEEEDGKELVIGSVQVGDFVGEMGLFFPTERRGVFLRTREACEVAEIDCNHLMTLLAGPLAPAAGKILYALGKQVSRRLLDTTRKASNLALLDVAGRMWRALEEVTQEPSALSHPTGIQIKVSRQHLAAMVGCSREMAGRVIKQFVAEGRMQAHGKTMIVNRAALAANKIR